MLIAMLVAGCQTAPQRQQPTFFAHAPQQAERTAQRFWNRTARLLQPLMPDTGRNSAGRHGTEPENQLALNSSPSDFLAINHSAHSLYKPGTIFPSPLLAPQDLKNEDLLTVESAETVVSATSNPLKIQSGDSELFQSLLREIAVVPADKRKVDDTKLKEWMASFREEIMNTDFEDEYLALLRRRILPESATPKSAAPLPIAKLAERKRPTGIPKNDRDFELTFDDDFENELVPPAPKRKSSNTDEAVVAQSTMPSTMQIAAPVYPSLTQLPGAVPAVAQASYQTQHVHNPAVSGYGAGDWQAPTRLAIEQLRYAIEQTPNGRTLSNEMRLRMLEMLLGNKSEAVRPMQSADKVINVFMGHQVLGFAALLDDTAPDSRGKHVSAAYRLNEGLLELQKLCPVQMKNVVFIEQCFGYGQFLTRPTQEFYPGETFHVYMEMENLVVRRVVADDGFEVNWSLHYEIRDSNANIVVKQDLGKPGERMLSRKRDHFHIVSDALPTSLSPGQYHLRISLTDLNDDSMQFAEEQIPFRVAPSQGTDSQGAASQERFGSNQEIAPSGRKSGPAPTPPQDARVGRR